MIKDQIVRNILRSSFDFETKRVFYYLGKKYPGIINCHTQHQLDIAAWKLTENLTKICTDLNMTEVTFFRHLGVLKKYYGDRKKRIALK